MIQRRTLTKFFFTFLATIFVLAAVVSFLLFSPTISTEGGVQYTIPDGAQTPAVINDLAAQNIISSSLLTRIYIRIHRGAHHLKAGEYLFAKGSSLFHILNQMLTGTGLVQHPFTIIAGWNFSQVRDALNREEKLRHDTQNLSDAEIMNRLGEPNVFPEGEFFPDTYFYTANLSDLNLLKRAHKKMQEVLNNQWQNRAPNIPFTNSYTALIAASLVEKEAHASEERPIIAGVFINRMKLKMLLQCDPTVIYGMGKKYTGVIHKKDLTTDTPYNTYVRKGLPPTPIAMPSLAAIFAVMHPATTDYLYFVARGDGHHQFSKTLQQHHQAVQSVKTSQAEQPFFNNTLMKTHLGNVLSQ